MGTNVEEKSQERQKAQEGKKRKKKEKREKRERETSEEEGSVVKRPCIPAQRPYPKNIKNYEFHVKLGNGNFGKVMLASLKNCEEKVAIKVIRKQHKEGNDISRFILAESRTLRITEGCPFLCHGYAAFQTQVQRRAIKLLPNLHKQAHIIIHFVTLDLKPEILYWTIAPPHNARNLSCD
ncbi:hypothetical protein XENTR_v10000722 [Xenopus tropicalis]|nr:hypothetical protein XENTR_v10000722 [Xenopus tropicalis]